MNFKIVSNLLNALQKQIYAKLDHYIDFFGPDADYELMEPLAKGDWLQKQPFADMEFEYEYFSGNLTKICNVVEMLHGTVAEDEFHAELTLQMKVMVEGRLQYHHNKRMAEMQLEWNYRLNKDIEKGVQPA